MSISIVQAKQTSQPRCCGIFASVCFSFGAGCALLLVFDMRPTQKKKFTPTVMPMSAAAQRSATTGPSCNYKWRERMRMSNGTKLNYRWHRVLSLVSATT